MKLPIKIQEIRYRIVKNDITDDLIQTIRISFQFSWVTIWKVAKNDIKKVS